MDSIDCRAGVELIGRNLRDKIVSGAAQVTQDHDCLLVRWKICNQNPMLRLAHVLAEAAFVLVPGVESGWNLPDMVRWDVGRAKRPVPT